MTDESALGRDEAIQEFRDLMAERAHRRLDRPWEFYKPLTKQDPFHRSKARTRAFIAANRAGKTEAGAAESVYRMVGWHPHRQNLPVPSFGWVISVSNEAQRDIIQPKFEKLLPKSWLENGIVPRQHGVWDQLRLPNGSIAGFKTCQQDRRVFQGTALHWLWADEEPFREIWDEASTRLTDYGGDRWMTMTPIEGMDWTFTEFVDESTRDKGSEVFNASMWDNAVSAGGYIPDAEIRRFEDSIGDPIMKRIRVWGEYHSQAGRIYKSFDRKIHGMSPEDFERLYVNGEDHTILPQYDTYVGIDTGRRFAAAFVLVDYFGNAVMFDEYYAEEQTISENARRVVNMTNQWGISPAFVCDRSSQFFVDLAEHGINAMHGDGEPENGIALLQQYMLYRDGRPKGPQYGNPSFYAVLPRCPKFHYQVQRYQWEAPSIHGAAAGAIKNRPQKKDDDMLDALRYVISTRPSPARPPAGEEDRRPAHIRIREKIASRAAGRVDFTRGDGLDQY